MDGERLNPLLHVGDLRVAFDVDGVRAVPVDGVSLAVNRAERVALVGESGSGKSLTALAILGLVPPPGRATADRIALAGQDIAALSGAVRRNIRGGRIAMIFQEPMTALNPVYTAGQQIVEAIALHRRLQGRRARKLAVELLDQVGIAEPARRFHAYPHELSGGMRQRVMIAMALAGDPELLIADEPTTALDVTIQAQVLDLLVQLCDARGMSLLLITHDLGVVAAVAHRTYVMYAGRIVEHGPTAGLLESPLHPYTADLIACRPTLAARTERMATIAGRVPPPTDLPPGCRYAPRCKTGEGETRCASDDQQLAEVVPARSVACWKAPFSGEAKKTSPIESA